MIGRTARWFDDRIGGAGWLRSAMRHVFPDHFSFMFGEIAAYSFMVLVATGVFLTFFFDPSTTELVYRGSYEPLQGIRASAAYESAVSISFDVKFGLLMRQMHHWAALVFLMAILIHLCRVFFTGAFRRPRELNWMVGVTLFLLALANGFFGYSLLDDLLSGTGLRIAYSIGESIPVVGPWAVFLFFGGEFPTDQMIHRMFIMHVFVLPAAIAGLLGIHLALVWRQKHTQFPGPLQREGNVVGSRLWPGYTARSVSLLLAVTAVLALLGGLVQINPIWLWGPYDPAAITTGAQPDWYVGWLEGSLRLFPAWEITLFGRTIPALFWAGVALPLVTFAALYAYPFVEKRLTGDVGEHELLEQPRQRPGRVAFGAGALTFYAVLFLAGSNDVLATWTGIPITAMVWWMRGAAIVAPLLVAWLARRWASQLAEIGTAETDDRSESGQGGGVPRPPHQRRVGAAVIGDEPSSP